MAKLARTRCNISLHVFPPLFNHLIHLVGILVDRESLLSEGQRLRIAGRNDVGPHNGDEAVLDALDGAGAISTMAAHHLHPDLEIASRQHLDAADLAENANLVEAIGPSIGVPVVGEDGFLGILLGDGLADGEDFPFAI